MINTLTINPAIDRILYMDTFERGETSRINRYSETIGGKATHVSINLNLMGESTKAFGIVHGYSGRRVIDMLESYNRIETHFMHIDSGENTRTNYLLVENNGTSSLLSEKGPSLSDAAISDLIDILKVHLRPNDAFVIAGDASNCTDPDVYGKIVDALSSLNLRIYLDASGIYLRTCLPHSLHLIKPNLLELSVLCGREVTCQQDDVIDAIKQLSQYSIPIVAVSLGKNGSIVKYMDRYYSISPPKVKAINTVGCGDCYFAGLIYGLENQFSFEKTLRFATATSAATAIHPLSVGFDSELAKKLESSVEIRKIK